MLINRNDETQTAILAGQYEELAKSGSAPHPQSPAGAALLRAYRQHQANQENRGTVAALLGASIAVKASRAETKKIQAKQAKKAAKKLHKARKAMVAAGPELEARAMRRSVKRIKSALHSGMKTPEALDRGFDAYREDGGRLSSAGWKRRMTEHLK
jgi:hypothetical protein